VSENAGEGAGSRQEEAVPGTVRLMTVRPIEMPLAAAGGQSSLAELIQERPWLVPAGVLAGLAVAGLALLAGRRLPS
jgi:hypothetical protein